METPKTTASISQDGILGAPKKPQACVSRVSEVCIGLHLKYWLTLKYIFKPEQIVRNHNQSA